MFCTLPAVHIPGKDSLVNEHRILRGGTFIIQIHGQWCLFSQGCVGIIHQCNQFGCHLLMQGRTSHGAAQHQVSLHRMSHRLMGQHTGQDTAQHHGLIACLRVDPFPLLHQLPIDLINFRIQQGRIREGLPKYSHPAYGPVQLNGHPGSGLRVQEYIHIASGGTDMPAAAIRCDQQLLHGILHTHNGAAGKIRIFLRDIGIYFPGKFNVALLLCVLDNLAPRDLTGRNHRQRTLSLTHMAIHEQGILRGRLQYGFRGLSGALCHGREPIDPVLVYPGTGSGTLGAHIACEIALDQGNTPIAALLCPQFGVYTG